MRRRRRKEKDTPHSFTNNLLVFLAVLGLGALLLLLYVAISSSPLDRIDRYEVQVVAAEDGSLDITYRYTWSVLRDSSEGALTWVQFGMANPNYELTGYGGAIAAPLSSDSANYQAFRLDREYRAGEQVRFWFSVHQEQMLCRGIDAEDEAFYDFTPGWFTEIPVSRYLFSWEGPQNRSHNADREDDGILYWSGRLEENETRSMTVSYPKSAFQSPQLVTWEPFVPEEREDDFSISSLFAPVLLLLYAAYEISWGRDRYRRGRGYYGSGHRGGRSGCACACAGCACACACAGGGRAGCSQKDFYQKKK